MPSEPNEHTPRWRPIDGDDWQRCASDAWVTIDRLWQEIADLRAERARWVAAQVEAVEKALAPMADKIAAQEAIIQTLGDKLLIAAQVLSRVAERGRLCAACLRELTGDQAQE